MALFQNCSSAFEVLFESCNAHQTYRTSCLHAFCSIFVSHRLSFGILIHHGTHCLVWASHFATSTSFFTSTNRSVFSESTAVCNLASWKTYLVLAVSELHAIGTDCFHSLPKSQISHIVQNGHLLVLQQYTFFPSSLRPPRSGHSQLLPSMSSLMLSMNYAASVSTQPGEWC